jgi:hypothetical protein
MRRRFQSRAANCLHERDLDSGYDALLHDLVDRLVHAADKLHIRSVIK